LPDEMKKTMDQCHAAMMKVVDKLKAGEPATLCQFCQSYGGLEMSGAKTQEIKSAAGYITLVTSDNPEVVKKIHAHAKKTKTEYEKMLAATGK
ncbi:MAG: hypothetical protein KC438_13540, partial [Thermomicrobiales bacterium]|nr:hypothetical protein [Thermomicrobiales bacterium]